MFLLKKENNAFLMHKINYKEWHFVKKGLIKKKNWKMLYFLTKVISNNTILVNILGVKEEKYVLKKWNKQINSAS